MREKELASSGLDEVAEDPADGVPFADVLDVDMLAAIAGWCDPIDPAAAGDITAFSCTLGRLLARCSALYDEELMLGATPP
mmetsp:Transcript_17492/g.35090  ORF Transcript_17492/g.35090 Transcript_17492/m.35090 type:complete len:81 (+) Transcript_17492:1033-1275(+)